LNGPELERDLYHDTEHRSSLLIRSQKNGVEVRGILNDELRIAPAVLAERSDEGLIPHEVFTVKERSSTYGNGKAAGELHNMIFTVPRCSNHGIRDELRQSAVLSEGTAEATL
ncbi:hypothetical protein MTO96_044525, partial [Rhipicephalus appendiculatus]